MSYVVETPLEIFNKVNSGSIIMETLNLLASWLNS